MVRSKKVRVTYHPNTPELGDPPGSAGLHDVYPNGRHFIRLFRYPPGESMPADHKAPDLVTKALDDLIVLAHEFGHYLSSREGNRTIEYVAAVNKLHSGVRLGAAEQELIEEEEERAWKNAGKVLKRLGFGHWRQFNAARRLSTAAYRDRLGGEASTNIGSGGEPKMALR